MILKNSFSFAFLLFVYFRCKHSPKISYVMSLKIHVSIKARIRSNDKISNIIITGTVSDAIII